MDENQTDRDRVSIVQVEVGRTDLADRMRLQAEALIAQHAHPGVTFGQIFELSSAEEEDWFVLQCAAAALEAIKRRMEAGNEAVRQAITRGKGEEVQQVDISVVEVAVAMVREIYQVPTTAPFSDRELLDMAPVRSRVMESMATEALVYLDEQLSTQLHRQGLLEGRRFETGWTKPPELYAGSNRVVH